MRVIAEVERAGERAREQRIAGAVAGEVETCIAAVGPLEAQSFSHLFLAKVGP